MEKKDSFQELLIRFLDGNLGNGEKARLLEFLRADKSNFKELLEVKDVWDATEANMNHANADTDESLLRLRKRLSTRKYSYKLNLSLGKASFIKIAAGLIILLSMSFLLKYILDKKEVQPISVQQLTYNEVVIPKGQKGQVTLVDGTKIWLNANSVLKYPSHFRANSRNIQLKGEAYLEVAKDAARPFFVQTSELTIKVLGTKFNIKAYPNDKTIETTLIEGSVKILSSESKIKLQELLLKPNEKATFDKVGKSMVLTNLASISEKEKRTENKPIESETFESAVEPIISWKDDKLIFKNESLAEMALKMERWFGVDVEFDTSDKKLNSYRYSGKFVYNESIEKVMEVISMTTQLHYEIDQNKVTIRKQ